MDPLDEGNGSDMAPGRPVSPRAVFDCKAGGQPKARFGCEYVQAVAEEDEAAAPECRLPAGRRPRAGPSEVAQHPRLSTILLSQ